MSSGVTRYPHTFRMLTATGLYWRLNLAMGIPVLFGVYRAGSAAFFQVALAIGIAVGVEVASALLSGAETRGLAIGQTVSIGIFVAAMTPLSAGPLFVTVAAAAAILLGLKVVGGAGRYWIHPAMIGLAVAESVFPNRLGAIPAEVSSGSGRLVGAVADFFGRMVFEPLAVRIPVDIWDRLTSLQAIPGAPIVAAAIPLILLASLIVYGEDLLPPIVPIAAFLAFVLAERFIGGEPLSALLNGTVLFALVYGPADPGVRPRSTQGSVVFALSLGLLVAIFTEAAYVTAPTVAAFLVAGSFVPLINTVLPRRR